MDSGSNATGATSSTQFAALSEKVESLQKKVVKMEKAQALQHHSLQKLIKEEVAKIQDDAKHVQKKAKIVTDALRDKVGGIREEYDTLVTYEELHEEKAKLRHSIMDTLQGDLERIEKDLMEPVKQLQGFQAASVTHFATTEIALASMKEQCQTNERSTTTTQQSLDRYHNYHKKDADTIMETLNNLNTNVSMIHARQQGHFSPSITNSEVRSPPQSPHRVSQGIGSKVSDIEATPLRRSARNAEKNQATNKVNKKLGITQEVIAEIVSEEPFTELLTQESYIEANTRTGESRNNKEARSHEGSEGENQVNHLKAGSAQEEGSART
jgi:hypothetical protein